MFQEIPKSCESFRQQVQCLYPNLLNLSANRYYSACTCTCPAPSPVSSAILPSVLQGRNFSPNLLSGCNGSNVSLPFYLFSFTIFVGRDSFKLQDVHCRFCKSWQESKKTQYLFGFRLRPSERDPWRCGQRTEHVSYRDEGRRRQCCRWQQAAYDKCTKRVVRT